MGGTVAYVNSVSGDKSRQSIPDYFLICPDKDGLACFAFEVEKGWLKGRESDKIPEFLHGIAISSSSMVIQNAPDKSG